MAVFCRLPSAFYSLLEELDKENTETRKDIRKMNDLLIFMMLNGGEKGMIEESAIVISHTTMLVSFYVCLSFQIATFFSHYFSLFFQIIILN